MAKLEYADAISRGLTAPVPNTMESTGGKSDWMPNRWATSATLDGPINSEIWAYTVFMDELVASANVNTP